MKRSLFSMMFAAAAALVSVSALTGCGGNNDGDNQNTMTPMSVAEFASSTRCYKLVNSVYGFVGANTPEAQAETETEVQTIGTFRAGNALDPAATLIYRQLPIPEDAPEGTMPSYALTISFQFSDQLQEADFLAVLGAGVQAGNNNNNNGEGAEGVNVTGGAITLTIRPDGTYAADGSMFVEAGANEEEENPDAPDQEEVEVEGRYLNMHSHVNAAY